VDESVQLEAVVTEIGENVAVVAESGQQSDIQSQTSGTGEIEVLIYET
jgi:hypothetical protein